MDLNEQELEILAREEPKRRVRLIRTLVFEGEASWIWATLMRSWVRPDRNPPALADHLTATESSRAIETIE